MTYAYIRDGVIMEIFEIAPKWPENLDVREVENGVAPGWVEGKDGKFSEPKAPEVEAVISPVEKLAAFLATNPDVRAMIESAPADR